MPQYFFAGIIAKLRTNRNREASQQIIALNTGSSGDDQIRQRKEATIVIPGGKIAKGVHPDQKKEVAVRIKGVQAFKNLHRIVLAGMLPFQIGDAEVGIAGNCGRDHGHSLRKGG